MVSVLLMALCPVCRSHFPLFYGMSRLHPLKYCFLSTPPPQFKYVDFNVEFINVMPFQRYY